MAEPTAAYSPAESATDMAMGVVDRVIAVTDTTVVNLPTLRILLESTEKGWAELYGAPIATVIAAFIFFWGVVRTQKSSMKALLHQNLDERRLDARQAAFSALTEFFDVAHDYTKDDSKGDEFLVAYRTCKNAISGQMLYLPDNVTLLWQEIEQYCYDFKTKGDMVNRRAIDVANLIHECRRKLLYALKGRAYSADMFQRSFKIEK